MSTEIVQIPGGDGMSTEIVQIPGGDGMSTEIVQIPALPPEVSGLVASARALTRIMSPEGAVVVAGVLAAVKSGIRAVDETFVGPCRAADAAKKALLEAKKLHREPLEDAETFTKGLLSEWGEFVAAERVRLEREAFARAKAERARLQAIADAEAVRRASLARDAETERLFELGQTAQAVALVNAPAPIALAAPVPPVRVVHDGPPPAPPAGVSFRTTWRAEVIDLTAFLGWILAEPSTRALYVAPVLASLSALARAAKREGAAPPGVRFMSEQVVASR